MAQLSISDIATKLRGEPDRDGDVYFAIKATVENESESRVQANVRLQAVDADDFLLTEVVLSGVLDAYESRAFTEKPYMKFTDYEEIDHWEVSDYNAWDTD